MLSYSKTVLIIGDEALYIFSATSKSTQLVEAVSWDAENFEVNVAKILSKDCGGKPVVIINDMVEQHYRKERVPKVGFLDRNNVVNRKLKVAFPNYPVKAALALKDKIAKTENLPAAYVYIFAAAPYSDAFAKTMAAARLSFVQILGFSLLPVESADMVKALSTKLTPKGDPRPRWSVFMGQHQNGALRQIVTKNGELALTRMTPIVDSDNDPDVWAEDVNQEFQATMSYMSRFGFTAEDGLDVTVIASEETSAILDNALEVPGVVHILTAMDAASKLGFSLTRQVDQRYADGIHAGWIGRKSRLSLPMQSREIESISKPRKVANFFSAVLALSFLFFAYNAYEKFGVLSEINTNAEDVASRVSQLDVQYKKEVANKEALGYDVKLIQSSIGVYEKFEKEDIKPLELFKGVGTSLGRDLKLDRIAVKRAKPDLFEGTASTDLGSVVDALNSGDNPENFIYEATLQLTFPSTTDIDKGNQEIEALKLSLEQALPNHKVVIQKYLKDTQYADELVVEEQTMDSENPAQDFIVSILIKGASS